ncbi:hypothetical protein [Rhizohabitans arisaemae]|uniref:hypothetical protein n=1 Tax=Rhizohabitans arisaemae TaxID=2720610 RepID=UPI0024B104F9|nr:hypothetical protein [Rhizohabitans arisaemae]
MTAVWVRAVVSSPGMASVLIDEHLRTDLQDQAWLPLADVIVVRDHSPGVNAWTLLAEVFLRHPGCLVAAVDCRRTRVVGTRDGWVTVIREPDSGRAASAVHAWTVAGGELTNRVTVEATWPVVSERSPLQARRA